jgi:hypothetical protein
MHPLGRRIKRRITMNTKNKSFLKETKEYNVKLIDEFQSYLKEYNAKLIDKIQSYLLPAFKGMTFGTPVCDCFDPDIFLSGKIFQDENIHYEYKILFYSDADEVRFDISRYQNGAITRIGEIDFWAIEGKNLTSKDIADKKRLLDAKLKEDRD